jgi:hypothetical protein
MYCELECKCGFYNSEHADWCPKSLSFFHNAESESEIFQSGSFFDDFLMQGLDFSDKKTLIFNRYFSDED